MKVYEHGPRRMWYDPHLRLWTIVTVDEGGNQIGDAEYENQRELAFQWLSGIPGGVTGNKKKERKK